MIQNIKHGIMIPDFDNFQKLVLNTNNDLLGSNFCDYSRVENLFEFLGHIKRGRMIPILPRFQLHSEKIPEIITRALQG